MMTGLRFALRLFSLMTLIGLVGCDTQVEHVWDEFAHQVQAERVELADQVRQPEVTRVSFNSPNSEPEEMLVASVPVAKSQKVDPAPQSSSFERYLTMNSQLYLSKAGELMADLTIGNNNFVSVNHITVHCMEYNMNHSIIREASIILDKTLQVGESSYWDQINFGYVHDDFETVSCEIANAKLS